MANDFARRVHEGLRRLRQADPDFRVFGSASHRYALNAPAREQEVLSFEATHGVAIPAAYRRFLLELGNGGAGPHNGLFPLGLWDGSGRGLEPWGEHGVGVLREPFPHRVHWNLPPERFEPPDFSDDDAEDSWQNALDDEYWDMALVRGAFPICHQGCANRNLLVVSGPERGQVWLDGRASDEGIGPEHGPDGQRLTFEAWYSQWLEDALKEASAQR